eukprot:scaffold3854_cov251-Pinguiococcus_pyrenoidosus.AAC.14
MGNEGSGHLFGHAVVLQVIHDVYRGLQVVAKEARLHDAGVHHELWLVAPLSHLAQNGKGPDEVPQLRVREDDAAVDVLIGLQIIFQKRVILLQHPRVAPRPDLSYHHDSIGDDARRGGGPRHGHERAFRLVHLLEAAVPLHQDVIQPTIRLDAEVLHHGPHGLRRTVQILQRDVHAYQGRERDHIGLHPELQHGLEQGLRASVLPLLDENIQHDVERVGVRLDFPVGVEEVLAGSRLQDLPEELLRDLRTAAADGTKGRIDERHIDLIVLRQILLAFQALDELDALVRLTETAIRLHQGRMQLHVRRHA